MEQIISNIIGDFERGKISRRTLVATLAAAAVPAPAMAADFGGKGFKALAVNHLSYGVADYARTRDFYVGLLGMGVKGDDGKQCTLTFGDSSIIARKSKQPGEKPFIDHVAYTIANFDLKAVEAELKRRGLNPGQPAGNSYIIKDPDGFDVQISSKDG